MVCSYCLLDSPHVFIIRNDLTPTKEDKINRSGLFLFGEAIMWNPYKDIGDAWTDTVSVWGKVSVVFYYLVLWVLILWNLWAFTDPLTREPAACVYRDNDPNVFYSIMIIRQWELFVIGFAVYAVRLGMQIPHVLQAFLVSFASGLFAYVSMIPHQHDPTVECFGSAIFPAWIFLSMLFVALIALIVDERIKKRSSTLLEESQPLHP